MKILFEHTQANLKDNIFEIVISITTGFLYWSLVIKGLIDEIKYQKAENSDESSIS